MHLGRWLQNRPHLLELAFGAAEWLIHRAQPLVKRFGYERMSRVITPGEELGKRLIFDCRMCGQCVLHSSGMTCPMTCPKNIRNGPCGGVRSNGNCEVKPEMRCIWVDAYERSTRMPVYGHEMILMQPPLNRQLEGSSAWINQLKGTDAVRPDGWLTHVEK